MKFLIASDIHGAKAPAEKIMELFNSGDYDLLLLLGDLLYHGPRNDLPETYNPKAVIKVLSALDGKILSVRGNCEAEVDQMVLPFPVLSECAMVFADGCKIMMTHGHLHTPEKHPSGIDAFFLGHTHIPVLEKKDGVIYLNPGSVSLPKGGFPPSYAVWDNGKINVYELWTGKSFLTFPEES
ncbi:MAG: phosphodiesterase [Spirochaetes bacterium]|uniref:Phosphoesterase n=1 Tax=Candidatus Ornithospirochaeta stercoripullorum TaxID=2840899 RepID=A0A9D9DZ67_9SPIO|nr:phosphodiesterase [Candidatus Ornithospirochaeta stercoripullorum]